MFKIFDIEAVTNSFPCFMMNRLFFLMRDVVVSSAIISIVIFISYFIRVAFI